MNHVRRHGWIIHSTIVLTAIAIFVVAAVVAEWPWWEYAFLSDRSAVSWLSSALLIANAAAALTLTVSRSLSVAWGALLTTSLTWLALDEQFLLHERWKEMTGPGLGNVPIVMIGIGGVVFVTGVRGALDPSAWRLIVSAVVIGLFALWVDIGNPPAALARTEELFEVIAESVFFCGLVEQARAHVQSAC
jgi:hypothetical protein